MFPRVTEKLYLLLCKAEMINQREWKRSTGQVVFVLSRLKGIADSDSVLAVLYTAETRFTVSQVLYTVAFPSPYSRLPSFHQLIHAKSCCI